MIYHLFLELVWYLQTATAWAGSQRINSQRHIPQPVCAGEEFWIFGSLKCFPLKLLSMEAQRFSLWNDMAWKGITHLPSPVDLKLSLSSGLSVCSSQEGKGHWLLAFPQFSEINLSLNIKLSNRRASRDGQPDWLLAQENTRILYWCHQMSEKPCFTHGWSIFAENQWG